MKLRGALILVPLVVSLFLPLSGHVSISPVGDMAYLVSLDVCNASGAYMSATADTPSLHESACLFVPFKFVKYINPNSLSFTPSLFFVHLERPPEL
jgi:hypothetical protein